MLEDGEQAVFQAGTQGEPPAAGKLVQLGLYPSRLGFAILECVTRVPGQGIATNHSKDYGEER